MKNLEVRIKEKERSTKTCAVNRAVLIDVTAFDIWWIS
jgi:hypothetical protein